MKTYLGKCEEKDKLLATKAVFYALRLGVGLFNLEI
jgi:hypothetical protein